MFGIQFAIMLSNLMIVERIFAWPGLGFYAAQAFTSSDLPAVLGVTIVFGAIYIAVSVAIELGQSLADPRIAL
jgi:peptide/nickel transport system permease protein/dipeptide transport system permease protein